LISLSDFLPKLRYLSISWLGLHRQFADGGDVGVVKAVGSADGQFDLVDRHVEQLAELVLLLADLALLAFELVALVADGSNTVEMMLEDGGGLG